MEGHSCWNGSHELARWARASNAFTWLIVEARMCMRAHCRLLIEGNRFGAEDWYALQRRRIDQAAQLTLNGPNAPIQYNSWGQWSDSTDRSMFGSPPSGRFGSRADDRSESSDGRGDYTDES